MKNLCELAEQEYNINKKFVARLKLVLRCRLNLLLAKYASYEFVAVFYCYLYLFCKQQIILFSYVCFISNQYYI